MKIDDRYASAVRSSNLKSKPETTLSDSDVLGAAGLAAQQQPLAIALARLFAGDNKAAREIVALLAEFARGRALRRRLVLKRTESVDVARAVLAWHRDGVCRACGGHGYLIFVGSPHLSSTDCPACKGTGKRLFEKAFIAAQVDIAHEVLQLLERELGRAGPAAMAKLAPRLDQ
jgi:hypothetical protein